MLTVIDGAGAPTSFDFPVDLDGVENLELFGDGSVMLMDGQGQPVYHVPAPWAYDALGNEVPSWYTISGDTLTLNVDHSAVEAYPVVADPWWNPFSWDWGSIFNKFKGAGKIVIKHARKCLTGSLRWIVPLAAGEVAVNAWAQRAGQHVAKIRLAGGPWGFVGIGVAGCIAAYL